MWHWRGEAEYFSDRGGLFSGATQALKEVTGTYEYKFGEGFISRIEYRRDWSNHPTLFDESAGSACEESGHADTGTYLVVWGVEGDLVVELRTA